MNYQLFINENEEIKLFFESPNWKVFWINLENKKENINLNQVFEQKTGVIYVFFESDDEKLLPFYVGQSQSFKSRWQTHKKNKGKNADFILLIFSEKLNNTNIRMYYENQFIEVFDDYPLDLKHQNKLKNKLKNFSKWQIKSEINDLKSLKTLINIVIPYNFFINKKESKSINLNKSKNENFNKEIKNNKNENLKNSLIKNYIKNIENKFFYINKKIKENYINVKAIYDFNNKKITILKNSWISKNIYSDNLYQKLINKINSFTNEKTKNHQLNNILRLKKNFKELINKKIIFLEDDKYIFRENYLFSPTTGTNFLFGYLNANNKDSRKHWKDNKEIDLKFYLLKLKKIYKFLIMKKNENISN